MRLLKLFSVSILLIISGLKSEAQVGDPKLASLYVSMGSFEAALDEYLSLLKTDPENVKYNYYAAVCYINTNFQKEKAIPFLEKVTASGKFDNNAFYLLGRAYHYNHQFDEAIKAYKTFMEKGGGSAATQTDVDKQMEYCENAKEIVKYKLDLTFENLGKEVNSGYAEYFPFIPVDESFIVYNSRREKGSILQTNGEYTSNVYISWVVDGKYQKGEALNDSINTNDGNEEIVGMSADGEHMILYFDNRYYSGDLLLSHRIGKKFTTPIILDETINSKFNEISAAINTEGTAIYFASDRKGGYGGTDIYISKKLPIGGWGPPQNLGPDINSPFDEDFPYLSPDGKTLYFSSKGHTSMGGYDIFYSSWEPDSARFKNVRNLGYPLNSVFDDMNYRVSESGKFGYIAALRPEGFGDFDLYRVNFNKIESKLTVIKGTIRSTDPDKPVEDVFISVTDKNGDLYGEYLPNLNTMRYIIILPPGNFNIMVESDGFEMIEKEVKILDKSSFEAEINADMDLIPVD